MKNVSNQDIARAIYQGAKDKQGHELSLYYKNVVQFLFRKRLLSCAPAILFRLRNIIDQDEGRMAAKISSVEKLDHKIKSHLEQSIKKRYSAKEIILTESSEPKLLGGIKIEVNDEVIDLSIQNRIGKLQEYLTKSV